jgi:ubiquinone/menaquinone biosynthesis C-methylase UbiE
VGALVSATILVIVGVILVSLAWRFGARRRLLPCPSWLVPALENPYVEALAGSSKLLDRAHVEEGMRILDVGAGPGRLALPAADRVGPEGAVVALDVQPNMLSQLRERVERKGIGNIQTVLAGAGEGKVERDAFDRAFLVMALGEIPDQGAALREILDALKPGGVLSITEVFPDPHYQRRNKVRRLAEEIGFHFDETFGSRLAFTMNVSKQSAVRL